MCDSHGDICLFFICILNEVIQATSTFVQTVSECEMWYWTSTLCLNGTQRGETLQSLISTSFLNACVSVSVSLYKKKFSTKLLKIKLSPLTHSHTHKYGGTVHLNMHIHTKYADYALYIHTLHHTNSHLNTIQYTCHKPTYFTHTKTHTYEI